MVSKPGQVRGKIVRDDIVRTVERDGKLCYVAMKPPGLLELTTKVATEGVPDGMIAYRLLDGMVYMIKESK
jgi:hypothetical protein